MILVTGGQGLVGRHLQAIMPESPTVHYLGHLGCELTDYRSVHYCFNKYRPDIVVHLAARVGGISKNLEFPVEFLQDNLYMNTNVIRACYAFGTQRLIAMSSTCVYPDLVSQYPMDESIIYQGHPTESHVPYAVSKRAMMILIDAYNKQYGTRYQYLIPCNLYGQGDQSHHCVQDLIQKLSNDDPVRLWGDGSPMRQVMYAGDLAQIIKLCVDQGVYDSFNVAPEYNLTLLEIASLIQMTITQHKQIYWDKNQPNGQYRKDVSSAKFRQYFPDFQFTPFDVGIKLTLDSKSS